MCEVQILEPEKNTRWLLQWSEEYDELQEKLYSLPSFAKDLFKTLERMKLSAYLTDNHNYYTMAVPFMFLLLSWQQSAPLLCSYLKRKMRRNAFYNLDTEADVHGVLPVGLKKKNYQ